MLYSTIVLYVSMTLEMTLEEYQWKRFPVCAGSAAMSSWNGKMNLSRAVVPINNLDF